MCCRYGHLTWEWAAGLRSYAHPLLFTPGLTILKLLHLDTPAAVQLAPRATQLLLSLLHDVVLLRFARTHLPKHLQLPALLVSSLSWFNCFTHTRPFSNCVESTLHLAALTFWPRINHQALHSNSRDAHTQGPHRRIRRAIAILLAGLCCVVRPPAAVLFLPVAALELLHTPSVPSQPRPGVLARAGHAACYLSDCLACASAILFGNGLLDWHFYGRMVFPAWVNLEFNVIQNSSADYGTHPAHWYFSQGMPAMLGSLLPLALWGIWAAVKAKPDTNRMPLWPLALGVWGIAMHSVLPHKEFRYILPSFELILMYAAVPLVPHLPPVPPAHASEVTSASPKQPAAPSSAHPPAGLRQRAATTTESAEPGPEAGTHSTSESRWQTAVAAAAIGLQLPMLAYFGIIHQRGTVAGMEHLSRSPIPAVRSLARAVLSLVVRTSCAWRRTPGLLGAVPAVLCRGRQQAFAVQGSSLLFLTNCHATPWQAHMHREDVQMTFLDCSPPEWFEAARAQNTPGSIGVTAVAGGGFRDEQRAFEADPMHWLCDSYGCGCDLWTTEPHSETLKRWVPIAGCSDVLLEVNTSVLPQT